MWEMGHLTVLHVRLGAKIGDRHAKDFNAFRKRLIFGARGQLSAILAKPWSYMLAFCYISQTIELYASFPLYQLNCGAIC